MPPLFNNQSEYNRQYKTIEQEININKLSAKLEANTHTHIYILNAASSSLTHTVRYQSRWNFTRNTVHTEYKGVINCEIFGLKRKNKVGDQNVLSNECF